jgi:hypothetical protein
MIWSTAGKGLICQPAISTCGEQRVSGGFGHGDGSDWVAASIASTISPSRNWTVFTAKPDAHTRSKAPRVMKTPRRRNDDGDSANARG